MSCFMLLLYILLMFLVHVCMLFLINIDFILLLSMNCTIVSRHQPLGGICEMVMSLMWFVVVLDFFLAVVCFGPAKTTSVSDGGQQYIAFCSTNIIVCMSSVIQPVCATKGMLALYQIRFTSPELKVSSNELMISTSLDYLQLTGWGRACKHFFLRLGVRTKPMELASSFSFFFLFYKQMLLLLSFAYSRSVIWVNI